MKSDINVKAFTVEDSAAELQRFTQAKETAAGQLDNLYQIAMNEVGGENAAIFMIHRMMMDDFSFVSSIEHIISDNHLNAEYAVSVTGHSFYDMFREMDDPYMQARSADIRDITERLLNILDGSFERRITSDEPVIIIADDLSPSEAIQLADRNILAFAAVHGSVNSHTSILARSMKLPSIIGTDVEISAELNGRMAVIDGYSGCLYIDPDEAFIKKMLQKQAEEERLERLLLEYRGRETVTADGKKIDIYANIGSLKEIDDVIGNDAAGVGLFRSEFIYLGRDSFPTEEELFGIYRSAAEKMGGRKMVIRTLDVGADRSMSYYDLPEEKNPALGCRGIRYLLGRPDVFKTQLRAIYRASVYGNFSLLYPMVSTIVDMGRIKAINAEVRAELDAENIPYKNIMQGILIETPSAVIISDLLAREADFLSIGTNDLAQYSLVIDRENVLMNEFFDPLNISLFRMIKMVTDNAHRYKKRIEICGEMAADLALTNIFLAMGVDVLSVTPSAVLPLRKEVCSTNVGEISQQTLQQLWV